MATEVNQAGYDVVSAEGQRISVKTTAREGSGGRISFNANTLEHLDRIIILRVNTDEMQVETLLDELVEDVKLQIFSTLKDEKYLIAVSKLVTKKSTKRQLTRVTEATLDNYRIIELENGTIAVFQDNSLVTPSKPYLRKIAKDLGVSIINSNGNPFNTRQLGSTLIREINS
jgi:hypothetical protein